MKAWYYLQWGLPLKEWCKNTWILLCINVHMWQPSKKKGTNWQDAGFAINTTIMQWSLLRTDLQSRFQIKLSPRGEPGFIEPIIPTGSQTPQTKLKEKSIFAAIWMWIIPKTKLGTMMSRKISLRNLSSSKCWIDVIQPLCWRVKQC